MKNKKICIRITGVIISILILMIIPLVILLRDNLVIIYGIQSYRNIRMISIISSILASVLSISFAFILSNKCKKEIVNVIDTELLISIQNDITALKAVVSKKWAYEFLEIEDIIQSVDAVVGYYKSIGDELMDGVHFELADTRSVLAKVLKAMSHYITQATRVMRVMSKDDIKEVSVEVHKCYEGVDELKNKAQDFVMSILDYMKDDSAEDDALTHICSFKEVILSEINLVDKYIKEGNI